MSEMRKECPIGNYDEFIIDDNIIFHKIFVVY